MAASHGAMPSSVRRLLARQRDQPRVLEYLGGVSSAQAGTSAESSRRGPRTASPRRSSRPRTAGPHRMRRASNGADVARTTPPAGAAKCPARRSPRRVARPSGGRPGAISIRPRMVARRGPRSDAPSPARTAVVINAVVGRDDDALSSRPSDRRLRRRRTRRNGTDVRPARPDPRSAEPTRARRFGRLRTTSPSPQHQRLRDVLRTHPGDAHCPPELKAWLLRTVGERRPAERRPERTSVARPCRWPAPDGDARRHGRPDAVRLRLRRQASSARRCSSRRAAPRARSPGQLVRTRPRSARRPSGLRCSSTAGPRDTGAVTDEHGGILVRRPPRDGVRRPAWASDQGCCARGADPDRRREGTTWADALSTWRGAGAGSPSQRRSGRAARGASATSSPRDVRAAAQHRRPGHQSAARGRRQRSHELRGYWALSSAAALATPSAHGAVRSSSGPSRATPPARTGRCARTTLGRGSALIHFGRLDDLPAEVGEALPAAAGGRPARGLATAHGLLAAANVESRSPRAGGRRAPRPRARGAQRPTRERVLPSRRTGTPRRSAASRLFDFAGALAAVRVGAHAVPAGRPDLQADRTLCYNCAYLPRHGSPDAVSRKPSGCTREVRRRVRPGAERRRAPARCTSTAPNSSSKLGAVRRGAAASRTLALASAPGDLAQATRCARAVRRRGGAARRQGRRRRRDRGGVAASRRDFDRLSDPCGVAESLVVCSAAASLAQGLGRAGVGGARRRRGREQFDAGGRGARRRATRDFREVPRRARVRRDVDDAVGRRSTAPSDAGRRRRRSRGPSIELRPPSRDGPERARRRTSSAAGDPRPAPCAGWTTRRGLLPPDALRSAFPSPHAPLYREALDAQVGLGRGGARLPGWPAASKSRALLSTWIAAADARLDDVPRRRGIDGLRIRPRRRLRAASRDVAWPRRSTRAGLSTSRRRQAARIEREMADVATRVVQPRRRVARSAGVARADGGGTCAPALADDEALVEYAFGARGLHAFVATPRPRPLRRPRASTTAADRPPGCASSRFTSPGRCAGRPGRPRRPGRRRRRAESAPTSWTSLRMTARSIPPRSCRTRACCRVIVAPDRASSRRAVPRHAALARRVVGRTTCRSSTRRAPSSTRSACARARAAGRAAARVRGARRRRPGDRDRGALRRACARDRAPSCGRDRTPRGRSSWTGGKAGSSTWRRTACRA